MSDSNKIRELIIYVCRASESDRKFGAVKLNKILFYADFVSYLRRGKSITDQPYFAIKDGPAPLHMVPIIEYMKQIGDIEQKDIEVRHSLPMKKTVALRDVKPAVLTQDDLVVVNEIIEKCRNKSGKDLTDESHRFAGWKIAFNQGPRTVIKYSMAQLDAENLWGVKLPPIPQAVIDYGNNLMGKAAWAATE